MNEPLLSEKDARDFIEAWNGSIDGDWKRTVEYEMYKYVSDFYEAELQRLHRTTEKAKRLIDLLHEASTILSESDPDALGVYDYIAGPEMTDVDQKYMIDTVKEAISNAIEFIEPTQE